MLLRSLTGIVLLASTIGVSILPIGERSMGQHEYGNWAMMIWSMILMALAGLVIVLAVVTGVRLRAAIRQGAATTAGAHDALPVGPTRLAAAALWVLGVYGIGLYPATVLRLGSAYRAPGGLGALVLQGYPAGLTSIVSGGLWALPFIATLGLLYSSSLLSRRLQTGDWISAEPALRFLRQLRWPH